MVFGNAVRKVVKVHVLCRSMSTNNERVHFTYNYDLRTSLDPWPTTTAAPSRSASASWCPAPAAAGTSPTTVAKATFQS